MHACPRYCPERPLPATRYLPGRGGPRPTTLPNPEHSSATWNGAESSLRSQADYRWGIDLYNHGYYWEAHEAWEALWHQAPRGTVTRTFLQGLIQCAAAALKARMGQPAASQRIAARGLDKLERSGTPLAGVDVRAFVVSFRAFIEGSAGARPLEPPMLELITQGA